MTLNARHRSCAVAGRRAAVAALARRVQPDVLLLQECSPEVLAALDAALPRHERVRGAEPGWETEGSIFYNADLLTLVEHGAEDVGLAPASRSGGQNRTDAAPRTAAAAEAGVRRLFWARLQPRLLAEL